MPAPDSRIFFPQLDFPRLQHIFTLRSEGDPVAHSCRESLSSAAFPSDPLIQAEQPHGSQIARVGLQDAGKTVPAVDGLISNEAGITLAIRSADCGPLFLYDPQHEAVGVVHSGRKGTEAGILPAAIQAMKASFQSDPASLIVVLAPCIRPPHYDSDFAATLRKQALDSGVLNYHDCGLNTGSDLKRFYSYRMEKGHTGRHYAAIRLDPDPDKS